MDFLYLFRLLLKRKWIIIGAAVLATAIAYWFTRNQPRQFKSTAEIATGFTTKGDDISIKGDENFNYYEAETKFNNVLVTFNSQPVVSLLGYSLILHDLRDSVPFRTLSEEDKKSWIYKDVDLAKAKVIFSNKLDSMKVLTSYNPEEKMMIEFLKLYGYDYNSLSQKLYVYRRENTDYIDIDFQSENPMLSAYVVNTAFYEFLRYYKTIRTEKSTESLDSLQAIVDRRKYERDSIDAILRANGSSLGDSKVNASLNVMQDLQTKLADERTTRNNIFYNLQNVNTRLQTLGSNSSNQSSNSNNELVALRRQRDDAYNAYLNSGSTDQALYTKYLNLKTQYENRLINSGSPSAVVTDNKSDLLTKKTEYEASLRAADDNIRMLESQINSLGGSVSSEASKSAATQTLADEAQNANLQYLAALKALNDAQDQNFSSVNNFKQFVTGQPAIDPEPSKRLLIVGGAGVVTFIISLLAIVFLAYLDTSVKTPAVFSKVVNLKLISMVNYMNLKNKDLVEVVTNKNYSVTKSDKERQNVFRESVRKLRYEVESSGKKIFLFTSSKKGEGKTTLIQALSFSMSLSKRKILIIDTNFCNNDLTVQLNGESVLANIDAKELSSIKDVKNMATDVGVGDVYLIGCESGDFTPSEILPRENLLQHLNELKNEYDYMFLEGPPLNDFTDSKELTDYVDGVIAVFSAQRNITQIDKESIKFFKNLNGKFCGAILNKVELENVNVT